MKIQCQSCQAKYTIADEKVLGKVVKIRCKKCSSTIVINGNESRPAEENADTHVFDYAAQSGDQWTVNVADGDQRTMTGLEIATEYRAGVITDETYCWKDGMADWLPLREIEQLYGAIKLGGVGGPSHAIDDDDVAQSGLPRAASANAAGLFGSPDAAPAHSPFAGGNGGASDVAQAAPAAARRGGGRGQGADLFGNVASAGGEEDVMTSAAGSPGGAGAGGGLEEQKLTGQRNESSVLFSLSALTDGSKGNGNALGGGGPGPGPSRTTATSDGSGLIDIRALSQSMGSDDRGNSNARVDDIMNLSGGGAFGAALTAPILAPPPLEVASYASEQSGGGKSNKLMFVVLGVAGLAIVALVVVLVLVLTRPPAQTDAAAAAASAAHLAAGAGAAGSAAPSATMASNGEPAGAAAGGTDNTPPPPGTGNANSKAPAAAAGGPAKTAATGGGGAVAAALKATAEPAKTADPPKAPEAPKDFGSALAQAAGHTEAAKPGAAAGGAAAPFDRGAASGALGGVNVQSCKKPDGPTGAGHVKVTFSPDGSVSSAVVDSGPYPGTPVGGCIAGKFRGAHVPAFSGGPVSVGKSFTIN